MNLKNFVSVAFLSVVTMFAVSVANAQEQTYVIACDAAYAPFSWEENGSYVGIDVEVLDAVAKEGGFNYELKPMNFDAIIPGLVSGQLDGAIAGISINNQRKQILDFSDGYFDSGLSVVVKEDSPYHTIEDLRDKKAAVKKGTTGSLFAETNASTYDFIVTYFTTSPETMLAVKNGNADFVMEDYPVIAYQIKIGAQKGLRIAIERVDGSPQYGFGVKKDQNQELLQKFNAGLKKIKENGTYDKIIAKYLG